MTATRDALPERLQRIDETTYLLNNRMTEDNGYGQEKLKDMVKKEAKEEQQQEEEEGIDLIPHEHERVLTGTSTCKTDIDSYFDKTKPHIKTLIEDPLKEIRSAKIIMSLHVIWKMPIKLLIDLDPGE